MVYTGAAIRGERESEMERKRERVSACGRGRRGRE